MRNALVLFICITFTSACSYFDKKVPSEQELLEKELNEINWSQIDEYPSVVACDSLLEEEQRKLCFFDFMSTSIQQRLAIDSLKILFPKLDTIQVKVTVYPNSKVTFEPKFPKDSVAYDTIKIDSILHARLVNFPEIKPAIKRGIPVKTQFVLPVILKME